MEKIRNACKMFGRLKGRSHRKDSDRVVKMDHGDIGRKYGKD
jgi:hypothetical protein